MKKIYSLQVFLAEVKKIADSVGEEYYTVRVEIISDQRISFDCYINSYGWHNSETMEGALDKLCNEVNKSAVVIDVEIEEPVKVPIAIGVNS